MLRAVRAKDSESRRPSPAQETTPYWLRLYVAGSSLKSSQAIDMLKKVVAIIPAGRCKVEVVDVYQEPELARQDNIVAAPSLVRIEPPPRHAFIGTTEDAHRVLHKLGIPTTTYGSTKTKKH